MLETIFIFGSFVIILYIANLVERGRQTERDLPLGLIMLYGLVSSLHLVLFFTGIGLQGVSLISRNSDELPEEMSAALNSELFNASNLDLLAVGLWLPALIGLVLLVPFVRKALARMIPIDPKNHIHTVSLSLSVLVVTQLLITLGIGLEAVAESLAAAPADQDLITPVFVQNILFVVMGLVGVGLFTRRSMTEASARLKWEAISLKEFGISFGLGVLMIPLLGLTIYLADLVGLGNAQVDALSEELYGPFFESFGGILAVALLAPIGEETLFRGAMQPRFGRFLTAILFAFVHGNYGLSVVTIGILVLGYILCVIRDRYSTIASMVMHASFNGVQALLAYVAFQYPELFEEVVLISTLF